jgi:hypothetical protein
MSREAFIAALKAKHKRQAAEEKEAKKEARTFPKILYIGKDEDGFEISERQTSFCREEPRYVATYVLQKVLVAHLRPEFHAIRAPKK